MRGFKSAGHAQRFLSSFGVISSFFRPGRHLLSAKNYREIMCHRFVQWGAVVNQNLLFNDLKMHAERQGPLLHSFMFF